MAPCRALFSFLATTATSVSSSSTSSAQNKQPNSGAIRDLRNDLIGNSASSDSDSNKPTRTSSSDIVLDSDAGGTVSSRASSRRTSTQASSSQIPLDSGTGSDLLHDELESNGPTPSMVTTISGNSRNLDSDAVRAVVAPATSAQRNRIRASRSGSKRRSINSSINGIQLSYENSLSWLDEIFAKKKRANRRELLIGQKSKSAGSFLEIGGELYTHDELETIEFGDGSFLTLPRLTKGFGTYRYSDDTDEKIRKLKNKSRSNSYRDLLQAQYARNLTRDEYPGTKTYIGPAYHLDSNLNNHDGSSSAHNAAAQIIRPSDYSSEHIQGGQIDYLSRSTWALIQAAGGVGKRPRKAPRWAMNWKKRNLGPSEFNLGSDSSSNPNSLRRNLQSSDAFTTLPFRDPLQCERKECLESSNPQCSEHLPGFYLKERGCANFPGDDRPMSCTACTYSAELNLPTFCECEKALFTHPSKYNEPCDSSRHCDVGQGQCFRPCQFFMHVSTCPLERCLWNTTSLTCVNIPEAMKYIEWNTIVEGAAGSELLRGTHIILGTSKTIFPLNIEQFQSIVGNYMVSGYKIYNLVTPVDFFQMIDHNFDGFIIAQEFEDHLIPALLTLEASAAQKETLKLARTITSTVAPTDGATAVVTTTAAPKSDASSSSSSSSSRLRELEIGANGVSDQEPGAYSDSSLDSTNAVKHLRFAGRGSEVRELQLSGMGNLAAHQQQALNLEDCIKEVPAKFYCSIMVSCMDSCSGCGWKTVEDRNMFRCDAPGPKTCSAVDKFYCGTDDKCHTSCSTCTGRPILDASQGQCLTPWWYSEPSSDMSTWICRDRLKVGRICRHDQDCIYGLRKCLAPRTSGNSDSKIKSCMPLRPYEETHVCETHYDCPHIGYYCPDDPTGADPYWIKVCRVQLDANRKCSSDIECKSDMLCNTLEVPSPRCRKLFSLPLGHKAVDPLLCTTSWTNHEDVCTYPAKSKRVGKSCDSDKDCTTTDPTGKTGQCACKDWWDSGKSKYCLPVVGDYDNKNEKMRDLLDFTTTKCGDFWTLEECMEEFGADARDLVFAWRCEMQTLSKGPYLPPAGCNIGEGGRGRDKTEDPRYVDYCSKLGRSTKQNGMDGAEGLTQSGSYKKGLDSIVVILVSVTVIMGLGSLELGSLSGLWMMIIGSSLETSRTRLAI